MHSLEEKHGSKRREPKWHGIWHVHQAWAYKKMRRNIIPINFSLQFSKQKQKLYKPYYHQYILCNEGKKTKI